MIDYKRLFKKLEEKGFTTYKIRQTRLMGNATYQNLRVGKGGIDNATLNRLCCVLECQPGDIMEYVPDEKPAGE